MQSPHRTASTLAHLAIEVGSIHPYLRDGFTIREPGDPTAGWIDAADLIHDAALLIEVIDRRCDSRRPPAGIGDAVLRSAVASTLYQTLTWRALGPAVAIASVHGGWERDAPGRWLRFGPDGSILMGHADAEIQGGRPTDSESMRPGDDALDAMRAGPWIGFLVPLAEAVRTVVRLGPRQLPGNAAAVLASVHRLMIVTGYLSPLDAAAAHARAAERLGLTSFGAWLERPDPWFRRSTCCLWFRVGGGLCGDCPKHDPAAGAEAATTWWKARRSAA